MEPSATQSSFFDPNEVSLLELADRLRHGGHIGRLLELARDEDLGLPAHDWTGELMFAVGAQRSIEMRAREAGIASGIAFIEDIVGIFDFAHQVSWGAMVKDGDQIKAGTVLATFTGDARTIVAIERTMLNLISRLCGIATRTHHFVELIGSAGAKICDTRKTTPGHRWVEKYAVRCGGGVSHRMGLYDAILIKDNHIAGLAGDDLSSKLETLAKRVEQIRNEQGVGIWFVQVEVDTLDQFEKVLRAKPGSVDMVLLDNMKPELLAKAVRMRKDSGSDVVLEASGGVNESTVAAIAQSGVDRISIGGLTHQATSLDLGFDSVVQGLGD